MLKLLSKRVYYFFQKGGIRSPERRASRSLVVLPLWRDQVTGGSVWYEKGRTWRPARGGWDASGKAKGPEMFVLKKTMLQGEAGQNPQVLPLPW